MKNFLIILLCSICYYGCTEKNQLDSTSLDGTSSDNVAYLKAIVRQTRDIYCYKPVLDFTEDSTKIYAFTNSRSLLFNVINLPTNLNVVNNKLYVQIAVLKPAEFYPCNALGVPYPALNITDAKIKE